MSTKNRKSEAEIAAEIAALQAARKRVRRFTMFRDDNHAAIDAQVDVLTKRMTADQVATAYRVDETIEDESERGDYHTLDAATAAQDWMECERGDMAPSLGWRL